MSICGTCCAGRSSSLNSLQLNLRRTFSSPYLHTRCELNEFGLFRQLHTDSRHDTGKADSSSSGTLPFADTPKGGHFPSGPKSARSFPRTSPYLSTSPTNQKAVRSQNPGQNQSKGPRGLPPSPSTPRYAFQTNLSSASFCSKDTMQAPILQAHLSFYPCLTCILKCEFCK